MTMLGSEEPISDARTLTVADASAGRLLPCGRPIPRTEAARVIRAALGASQGRGLSYWIGRRHSGKCRAEIKEGLRLRLPSFAERQQAAADARKHLLDQHRARLNAPEFAERQVARQAVARVRQIRIAQRKEADEARRARDAEERAAQEKAERAAREAALEAELAARQAAAQAQAARERELEEALLNTRKERKKERKAKKRKGKGK